MKPILTSKSPQVQSKKERNPTTNKKLADIAGVSEKTYRMGVKILSYLDKGWTVFADLKLFEFCSLWSLPKVSEAYHVGYFHFEFHKYVQVKLRP